VPQSVVVSSGNRTGTTTTTVSGTTGLTGDQLVSGKATPEEIKEKMEQQLRMQRAAHQQKRALETLKNQPVNSSTTQLVKVTANSSHGKLMIAMNLYKLNLKNLCRRKEIKVLNKTQIELNFIKF
jgi:hypothetical protein